MTSTLIEPMRDVIGAALYNEFTDKHSTSRPRPDWYGLSEERREPWRVDADRVIESLKQFALDFGEYCYSQGGADYLAVEPREQWEGFLETIQKTKGP